MGLRQVGIKIKNLLSVRPSRLSVRTLKAKGYAIRLRHVQANKLYRRGKKSSGIQYRRSELYSSTCKIQPHLQREVEKCPSPCRTHCHNVDELHAQPRDDPCEGLGLDTEPLITAPRQKSNHSHTKRNASKPQKQNSTPEGTRGIAPQGLLFKYFDSRRPPPQTSHCPTRTPHPPQKSRRRHYLSHFSDESSTRPQQFLLPLVGHDKVVQGSVRHLWFLVDNFHFNIFLRGPGGFLVFRHCSVLHARHGRHSQGDTHWPSNVSGGGLRWGCVK